MDLGRGDFVASDQLVAIVYAHVVPLVGLWYASKLMPTRLLDRLMVKRVGLEPLN